jgi:CheY-like chemotaxis protein
LQQLGIAYYLNKPVRQSYLYDAITRLMGPAMMENQVVEALPPTAPPFLRGRLLLAEDNPINQQVAVQMLGKLGYQVTAVDTGQAVLEALAQANYDAVLMDCQMPVMDGLAATEAIRQQEQAEGRRRLPIIAVTANAMASDREQCLAAGMDDFLSKPFRREQLREMLERWVVVEPLSSRVRPALADSGGAEPDAVRHDN